MSAARARGLTAAGKARHEAEADVEACDPRVARSRAAVLEATLELLGEAGHTGATVEAIAERSGVAKTTIYRHWPSRGPLLFDALHSGIEKIDVTPTGDVRADLLACVQGLATKLRDPRQSRIMATMIDAAESDPELADLAVRFTAERQAAVAGILRAGIEAGELDPGIDVELGGRMIGGALFYCRLMLHAPADEAQVEKVVDQVLDGLRRR